jgi:hypothetical protein
MELQSVTNTDMMPTAALPRMGTPKRCRCGNCRQCRNDAKWDRVFDQFAVKVEDTWGTRGIFGSMLRGW